MLSLDELYALLDHLRVCSRPGAIARFLERARISRRIPRISGPMGLVLLTWMLALPAHASGGGPSLQINQMLEKVLQWLSGSLAITIGTIALVAAAFVWMFLRHERGADFAFRALLGTAIAIGAANMIESFLGSGALL